MNSTVNLNPSTNPNFWSTLNQFFPNEKPRFQNFEKTHLTALTTEQWEKFFPSAYPLPELLISHYSQLLITLNGKLIQKTPLLLKTANLSNSKSSDYKSESESDTNIMSIPDQNTPEYPIYCLHLIDQMAPDQPPAVHYPKTIVKVGTNSHITLIEHYLNLSPQADSQIAATEIIQAPHSTLYHYVIQQVFQNNLQSIRSFQMIQNTIRLSEKNRYHGYLLPISGQHNYLNHHVLIQGEQTETEIFGLNYLTQRESSTVNTQIHHASGNSSSHTILKSICKDQAISTIGGEIFVEPSTPNTRANFENKNLLLSPTAQVISKPILEINHNHIQCTHGATCGPLDAEALFYLTSRGLSTESAKELLITGFIESVLTQINIPEITALIQAKITQSIMI